MLVPLLQTTTGGSRGFRDWGGAPVSHQVEVEFDDFSWDAVTAEARRQGVPVEELIVHAVMYFVADADSGRVAHRAGRFTRRSRHAPPRKPLP